MHNSGYIREDSSSVYCHREKRNFRSQMQNYHVHNAYELYYLFDGRVQYSIEGETYDLKEGSIVFISKAAKLLRETNLSITEIASGCGFNNSNYFSAVFKKRIGTLPLKYRKENKGDMANEI